MSHVPLSDAQRAALAAVLDAIIPRSADGRLPGAGELGLARGIEQQLGAMVGFTARSLDALDALARERQASAEASAEASGFAALGAAARAQVLDAHAAADPGFLPGLVFQAYSAYYQHPRALEGLGLEPRPPHPKGYALDQPDLDALLAPVRARAKLYREA